MGGDVPIATMEDSGALILLAALLKGYPKLGVKIRYREAPAGAMGLIQTGYDVEFHDETEPILRETAPVLRHALLAALARLVEEWLPGM